MFGFLLISVLWLQRCVFTYPIEDVPDIYYPYKLPPLELLPTPVISDLTVSEIVLSNYDCIPKNNIAPSLPPVEEQKKKPSVYQLMVEYNRLLKKYNADVMRYYDAKNRKLFPNLYKNTDVLQNAINKLLVDEWIYYRRLGNKDATSSSGYNQLYREHGIADNQVKQLYKGNNAPENLFSQLFEANKDESKLSNINKGNIFSGNQFNQVYGGSNEKQFSQLHLGNNFGENEISQLNKENNLAGNQFIHFHGTDNKNTAPNQMNELYIENILNQLNKIYGYNLPQNHFNHICTGYNLPSKWNQLLRTKPVENRPHEDNNLIDSKYYNKLIPVSGRVTITGHCSC